MRALATIARTLAPAAPAALVATTAVPGPADAAPPVSQGGPGVVRLAAAAPTAAVIGSRVIGRSSRGRAIRAFHLGEPGTTKVVLVSAMHGNEAAPRQILWALRDGDPIRGVDLWVIPTYNPDGVAATPARTPAAST